MQRGKEGRISTRVETSRFRITLNLKYKRARNWRLTLEKKLLIFCWIENTDKLWNCSRILQLCWSSSWFVLKLTIAFRRIGVESSKMMEQVWSSAAAAAAVVIAAVILMSTNNSENSGQPTNSVLSAMFSSVTFISNKLCHQQNITKSVILRPENSSATGRCYQQSTAKSVNLTLCIVHWVAPVLNPVPDSVVAGFCVKYSDVM